MQDKEEPKQDAHEMNDALGMNYHVEDDGSWKAETKLGTLSADASGHLTATLGKIKTVCVGDITSIKSYQIDENSDTVTHSILFRNGGSCRLTYAKTGQVKDFEVGKIRIRISHDYELILNPPV